MAITDEQLAKLPAYARNAIVRLRAEVERVREERAQALHALDDAAKDGVVGETLYDVWRESYHNMGPGQHQPRKWRLPADDPIVFRLPSGIISVERHQQQHPRRFVLEVTTPGARQLVLSPQSLNRVYITVED